MWCCHRLLKSQSCTVLQKPTYPASLLQLPCPHSKIMRRQNHFSSPSVQLVPIRGSGFDVNAPVAPFHSAIPSE